MSDRTMTEEHAAWARERVERLATSYYESGHLDPSLGTAWALPTLNEVMTEVPSVVHLSALVSEMSRTLAGYMALVAGRIDMGTMPPEEVLRRTIWFGK